MSLRSLIGISVLAGSLLYSAHSLAEVWIHEFTSRIASEYDSNPALTPAYPGGVWRTSIDPSYAISRNSGADKFTAGVALQLEQSSNDALSQKQNNPSALVSWSRQSGLGAWGLSSRYAEIATRNAGIDAIGFVPVNSTRTSRTVAGNWIKELDQRTVFETDATYDRVSYHGGSFVDFSTQYAGLKISYAMSEAVTTSFKISGDSYDSEMDGLSSRRSSALWGAKWKQEYSDIALTAGWYNGDGNSGWLGGLRAQKSGERYQMVVDAERKISSGGLEGFVTDDQVKGNWGYHFSELGNVGVDFELRINGSASYRSQRTSSGVWLQRSLSAAWGLKTYYQHIENRVVGMTGASSSTVGLALNYASAGM